jgi:hypothetical protein
LYYGIYGANGDHFYQVNPSNGNAVLLFTNPAIGDCFGMTWDGSSLWITDHETSPSIPAKAIELDLTGNILSQFDLPDHYMSGIAYDNGDFWVSTYYPDPGVIYKVDGTGAVLSQFTPMMVSIFGMLMVSFLLLAPYTRLTLEAAEPRRLIFLLIIIIMEPLQ